LNRLRGGLDQGRVAATGGRRPNRDGIEIVAVAIWVGLASLSHPFGKAAWCEAGRTLGFAVAAAADVWGVL